MRMRKQSGFTLVELIVVIVILGILAAMALPRFAGMQGDARLSKMQGLLGAMRSASALAHSAQLVTLNSLHTTAVTLEGKSITMDSGYPTIDSILVSTGVYDGVALANTIDGTEPKIVQMGDYVVTKYVPGSAGKSGVVVIAPDKGRWDQCVVAYVEPRTAKQSGNAPLIGIFGKLADLGTAPTTAYSAADETAFNGATGKTGGSGGTAITGRDCE